MVHNFFLSVFGLVALSTFSLAEPKSTTHAPMVEWQISPNYDFGLIEQDKPVATIFTFRNISNKTISIETARTACGCTVAQYTLEPIPPQRSGTIEVTYNASKKGYFSKKIKVYFLQQKKAETLSIEGEVD